MPTSGGLVTKQELIDAQLDTAHLGRVVNSKDVSGNPISTSTNRTGGANKTLDALQEEYQSAIQSAGGVSLGTWTSGVTTFNEYNEYAVFNGIPYKPKASTGLPYVAQGADPTVAPDDAFVQPYVEVDNDSIKEAHGVYGSYAAEVISDIDLGKTVGWSGVEDTVTVQEGQLWSVEDYAAGNNSGRLFFKVVAAATGTDDGGKYIDLPISGLQLRQNLPKIINAKCFGLKGNYTDNDLPQLIKLWDYAPWGSKILYPAGHYRFDGGHTHPLKQLYHTGVGRSPTFVPSAINISGTSFYFPTFSGLNKGGIYMPPAVGSDFCRFSSFEEMTLFGDGTNDDNGTVTCLKINNLGTHLKNVDSRYGAVGIENNYSVGANWDNLKIFASTFSVIHFYDPATPFVGGETNSVATENIYTNIQVATSKTNASAIGWYVDATCAYANNHHGGSFDAEQCYTGMRIEGRIAAKDHDGIQVFGAASFQSVGNIFDSLWFEGNAGNNLELVNDPGQAEPALTIRNKFEDVEKVFSTDDTQNTLSTPTGDRPLKLGSTKDAPQGVSGGWGSPFTSNQYLLHGKTVNAPLMRNIIAEKIPKISGNRSTINDKAVYEWTHAKNNVPLVASTINMANLDMFGSTNKSVMLDYSIVGTGNLGTHYAVTGKIQIKNDSDAITFTNMPSTESFLPAGTKPLTVQAIRVSVNTFGLFLFKDATVTETVNATVDLKLVVGAGNASDRQSVLTTFSV